MPPALLQYKGTIVVLSLTFVAAVSVGENRVIRRSLGVPLLLHNSKQRWRSHYPRENTSFFLCSRGRTSFGFGGTYNSNGFSMSLGQQTLFYPALRNPWQRTLAVTLSIRLPHDSQVSVNTVALPNGKLGYSAYGSTWSYREGAPGAPRPAGYGIGIGKFSITGRVVDGSGKGVEGICLKIGDRIVYTGSDGSFALSVRKRKRYPVVGLPEQCLSGHWHVVNASGDAVPGEPITVTVEKEGQ